MNTKHRILVGIAIVFAVASQGFGLWLGANAQAFYVPSGSMEPTLPLGSRVLG